MNAIINGQFSANKDLVIWGWHWCEGGSKPKWRNYIELFCSLCRLPQERKIGPQEGMLNIKVNDKGDVVISGDTADLRDLKYQISEVLDHEMHCTKTYQDFKWNAWETQQKPISVTVMKKE